MSRTRIFLICILLTGIILVRFYLFYHNQPHYRDGQLVTFTTTLLSEPKNFSNQQILYANLGSIKNILIKTALYPQFYYGDSVRISGTIKVRSLKNEKTIMVMYFPKIETLKKDKNVLLAVTSLIRQKTISLFKKTFPQTYASLLLGIVFGIKQGMPRDFADNLRSVGVMHVVAASGMNVTIVGGFLSSIFTYFLRRQVALILTIIGIMSYAVLAGLEASILRASIMGILVFVAQILGRQSLASYGLFIAAYIMLFYSPKTIFDVGFQLSFLATLGLLYIKPIFERDTKVKRLLKTSVLGEGATTTISAQIATLPILLTNFGSYSLWSVLVNGLVLWTTPTLMAIGGIGAIAGIASFELGRLLLYFSLPFLFYFEEIVQFFANLPGILNIVEFPWQMAVGYYFIVIAALLLMRKKAE